MSPTVRERFLGLLKYAVIAGVLLVALMFNVPDSLKFFGYGSRQALHEENESYIAQPVAVDQASTFGYRAEAKKLAVSSRARGPRGTFAVQDALTTPSMIVKTSDLSLLARVPVEEMARIEQEVRKAGGLVLTSTVEKRSAGTDAVQMLLRVPVARFEEVRAAIKQGVIRVDRDSVEAKDVTKEFVDSSARLDNLRAREAQYRAILSRAYTVADILQVTEKLSEVRGEIEALQGHLNYLKNQAEMSTLRVSIQAEADAQVAGITWRPLYQLRAAMMGGVAGLTDYANTMFVLLFRVPAILLWLLTLVLGGMIGWRVTLWVWTRLRSLLTPAAKTA